MDADDQRSLPVANTVEVQGGGRYADAALYPRVKALAAARDLGALADAADAARESLAFLGTRPSITLRLDEPRAGTDPAPTPGVLPLRTIVDLTDCAASRWTVDSAATLRSAQLGGTYVLYNPLRLGDSLELRARGAVGLSELSAGSAAWTVPLARPLRAGLVGSYSTVYGGPLDCATAQHGVSAHIATVYRGARVQVGARAANRHVCAVGDAAHDRVRAQAGESSLKVALFGRVERAARDSLVRSEVELAGHPGDAAHVKATLHARARVGLPPKAALELAGHLGALAPLGAATPGVCDSLLPAPGSLLVFPRASSDVAHTLAYSARAAFLADLPGRTPGALRAKLSLELGQLGQLGQKKLSPLAVWGAGLNYSTAFASFDVLCAFPVNGEPRLCTGVELLMG